MKSLFSASICGMFLTFALAVSADEIKQGVATVVRVQGQASYTLGGSDTWHPLVAGKILQAGSVISTKPDATVDVVLGKQAPMPQAPSPTRVSLAADSPVRGIVGYKPAVEQNIVRLSGGTTLKIDTLTVLDTGVDTVSDTELDLQAGRIFASVKKLSDSSKYLVKIPNGIAGVRGTKFTLGADGSAGCIEHSVMLSQVGSGGAPVTVEVTQGNQYNPSTGKVEPLSPELQSILKQIAMSATTTYLELTSYAPNWSQWSYISPTAGYSPNLGNLLQVSQ
ncbi:MAG: FecR domain-containing protein [Limisphaerales bacterium]